MSLVKQNCTNWRRKSLHWCWWKAITVFWGREKVFFTEDHPFGTCTKRVNYPKITICLFRVIERKPFSKCVSKNPYKTFNSRARSEMRGGKFQITGAMKWCNHFDWFNLIFAPRFSPPRLKRKRDKRGKAFTFHIKIN